LCLALGAPFGLSLSGPPLEAEGKSAPETAPPTFHAHVLPILKRKCLSCHGGEEPKGELNAETYASFRQGGKRGATVVPGKPAESLVFQLLSGVAKPPMPPKKAEPLSEAELATVRAWIEGGASEGDAVAAAVPYSEPPVPPRYSRSPVIAALLYSGDGKKLFVVGYREVLVHDLEKVRVAPASTAPALRLVGEAERILSLSLSADEKLLATAGGSPGRFGEVQVWDLEGAGRLRRFLRLGRDVVCTLAFLPAAPGGSPRLVVAGTDRTLRVLDLAELSAVHAAEIHADWVLSLAPSADGIRVFSGSRDRTVKVFDAVQGAFLSTLATLDGAVTRVCAQPGGDLLLLSSEGREAALWSQKDLKELRKLEKQPGPVLAAAFSRDGHLVALAGAAPEVYVYQAADSKRVAELVALEGWNFAIDFRPDAKELAVAGYEGKVRLFDLEAKKEAAVFVPVPLSESTEESVEDDLQDNSEDNSEDKR
jgi:WD40 repeat protein/mono/diheme cytochrome c family protein